MKKIIWFLIKKPSYGIGFKIFLEYPSQQRQFLFEKLPNRLRIKKTDVTQFADPFVLVDSFMNEWVFYEEKTNSEKGILKCISINSNLSYTLDLGINCHLSFPFIISQSREYFMIPETAELNEVAIYKSEIFPWKWKRHTQLLSGKYVDSHILVHNEIYYLFTTEKVHTSERYALQLYTSKDLFNNFKIHPCSPIKMGKKFGRSGGHILQMNRKLYRFSQNCENRYGQELQQFEIIEITETTYQEKLIENNFIFNYMDHKRGGHHISKTYLGNDINLLAVDLNYRDSYFQRFFNYAN